jgi:anaerobic ribonucleoside-triphosphate reductase
LEDWGAEAVKRKNKQILTPEQKVRKKAYMCAWAAKNRRQVKILAQRHRDKRVAQGLPAYRHGSDYHREKHLKRKYGITTQERDAMIAAQDHACAICRSPSPGTRHGWVVDHCHATGKVRQILCQLCNLMLGSAHDDPIVLQAAIRYLEAHK